jgi:lipoate-protein ligase A
MAVDEAILTAIGMGEARPTLRMYAWDPACLSLGYAQPFGDVDTASLAALGWDVVRRPTGGRAILHTDELTYSVIGPAEEPHLAGGILESYQVLSQALLAALLSLSVPARSSPISAPAPGSNLKGPVCFEVPSNYEITVDGKKLVGSAQARRKEGVLQHGSLPICGDLTRIMHVLCFPDEIARSAAAARLLDRATTLETILGYQMEWKIIAEAFVSAFQEQLNISLEPGDLTDIELEVAEKLVKDKYANPGWTQKV